MPSYICYDGQHSVSMLNLWLIFECRALRGEREQQNAAVLCNRISRILTVQTTCTISTCTLHVPALNCYRIALCCKQLSCGPYLWGSTSLIAFSQPALGDVCTLQLKRNTSLTLSSTAWPVLVCACVAKPSVAVHLSWSIQVYIQLSLIILYWTASWVHMLFAHL